MAHRIDHLLVICPSWVGDTVMATPFLSALRGIPGWQEARVTAYGRPGLDEILAGSGLIDEMITGRPSGVRHLVGEAKRLKVHQFDAVILLPNSWRTAMLVRLARIRRRIGYNRDGRGWLLTDRIVCPMPGGWNEPISAVDYYLHLAEHLGSDGPVDRRIQLGVTAQQNQIADEILDRAGVADGTRFALLNPGANRLDKRWPVDRFASLADHLIEKYNLCVLVNGSPAETDLLNQIVGVATRGPVVNLQSHGITLGSLKALCARCDLVVTNDTGTRHIAAGVANRFDADKRCGIVTLFGPTNPAWARIDYEREIALHDEKTNRIDSISLEQVIEACDCLLCGTDANERPRGD